MKQPGQNGFSIIAAIFILVVLAALGAFMVTISTTQQVGSALDIQGSRAYQAARSGIEWGLYKVQSYTLGVNNGYRYTWDCPVTDTGSMCPNRRSCPAAISSFAFPAGATTLAGFTVTVTCVATPDPGGFSGPTTFTLTATACNQPLSGWASTTTACPNTSNPNGYYVERRLDLVF